MFLQGLSRFRQKTQSWTKQQMGLVVLLIVVLMATVAVVFYQQEQKKQRLAQASETFFALFHQNDSIKDKQVAIRSFIDSYPETYYAQLFRFMLAMEAIKAERLEEAAHTLEAIMAQLKTGDLATIARLRLARVQVEQGKLQEAMENLSVDMPVAYTGLRDWIQGDIHLKAGRLLEAEQAYAAAAQAFPSEVPLLLEKQTDLGGRAQ